MTQPGIWIVVDERVGCPQPVLAVFGTQDEAKGFVDAHVPADFEELAYSHYDLGWTFDGTKYSD